MNRLVFRIAIVVATVGAWVLTTAEIWPGWA